MLFFLKLFSKRKINSFLMLTCNAFVSLNEYFFPPIVLNLNILSIERILPTHQNKDTLGSSIFYEYTGALKLKSL